MEGGGQLRKLIPRLQEKALNSATMASVLIKLSLVVIFLPGVFLGCAKAQVVSNQDRPKTDTPSNLDLSTNEAVLAELQRRLDAKNEELGNKGGRKLEARFICIKRLKESAEIIVIGGFAYDRGCRFQGAFVNSRYFEKDDPALSKNALAALGWETANQGQREKLALLWVEKGLVPFFTVLYTTDKELNDREFQPPQVVSTVNGEIKVTLWVRLPTGRGEQGYQHVEYRFSRDGNLSGSSTLTNLLI
jgi:hypothetical protein